MKYSFLFLLVALNTTLFAGRILIPMDEDGQKNHLKAYGITYWALENGIEADWLLNYRGGSFLLPDLPSLRSECQIRGISFITISEEESAAIIARISSPELNMDVVHLEKAPKIAVYSPKGNLPWDDAVTLVLTYAEIPYDVIYDEEVLNDKLIQYEWLHLHHEDFTGQYGKFYGAYGNAAWYIEDKRNAEAEAKRLGYSKVSALKLDVSKKIKEYVVGGGFLFAMCSATDSYDIALSAEGVDICDVMFDGDPIEPGFQGKIDYSKTLAFRNFKLSSNPNEYEFSDIDMTQKRHVRPEEDFFVLFDYSAKWDVIPTMLCQNHTRVIKGFMGQTTSFDKRLIKSDVLIMGELKSAGEARYIHGEIGKGQWTFYGGHDPEDYQHRVGDPKTELALYPTSPGYRLILNNILFPAARKKKQKT